MRQEEAERELRQRIVVTPQLVTAAKAIVLNCSETRSTPDPWIACDELLGAVLRANSLEIPRAIVVHTTEDSMPSIVAAGEALRWRLAAAEAIWSLIHSGLLFARDGPRGYDVSIGYTTGSGHSGGWDFPECALPLPNTVRPAPSHRGARGQFLAEPDLYLHALGVQNMHPEVASSFQEAVRCFRAELFTAALAMLGKASEGSWLEMGAALLRVVPQGHQQRYTKQHTALEDPMKGMVRKIEAILTIYEHQDDFASIAAASGVRLQDLRNVAVWSDAVRDSRNTIHFGVNPATPNTYEKLAALLIGAAPNVRTLYRVKEAADAA